MSKVEMAMILNLFAKHMEIKVEKAEDYWFARIRGCKGKIVTYGNDYQSDWFPISEAQALVLEKWIKRKSKSEKRDED